MTRLTLAAITLFLAAAPLAPVAAQDLLWVRQAGSTEVDYASGVALDGAGNVYVSGTTSGSLGGPSAGDLDLFLAKYSASGALLWTRQAGTSANESVYAVAVDGGGNAYITGYTLGSFGGPRAGDYDIFVTKYDTSGVPLWTRQIGTPERDVGTSVAVDGAGNAYITGYSDSGIGGPKVGQRDAFLIKYDASGSLVWKRQVGSIEDDTAFGVAVDSAGNIYITGSTLGSFDGSNAGLADTFLVKYDESGVLLWKRQTGTATHDFGRGVAVDGAGNVFISGNTYGSLGGTNAGQTDIFLVKYDSSGTVRWKRQFGSPFFEYIPSVAVDGAGNAYITGQTEGSLSGPNAGQSDIFLAIYSAPGARLSMRQLGTSGDDEGWRVAVDGVGNAYITGYTWGSLGGPNAGNDDYFLAKFSPPPCPADFNHDGFVTGDDFDSFSLAFIAGDAAADFDHNGFVTGDDFDAYVAAFEAGC